MDETGIKKILQVDSNYYVNKTKAFDLKVNPISEDEFSFCDLEGKISFCKVEDGKIKRNKRIIASKGSVLTMDFSEDGEKLIIGSSANELTVIQDFKFSSRKKTKNQISKVKHLSENVFVCGDVKGEVKLWDLRTNQKLHTFQEQVEEITDFEYNEGLIVASSIEGTLGVYDIRKMKKANLYALSDNIEDELLCMSLINYGKKVICGTSDGPLVIFQWDWFGDFKNRLLGHPSSIFSIAKYDEYNVFTACEDGLIRYVSISPNKLKNIIVDKFEKNQDFENKNFKEVNCLGVSRNQKYLFAISNINVVKCFNLESSNLFKKNSDNFEENNIDVQDVEEDESLEQHEEDNKIMEGDKKIVDKSEEKEESYSEKENEEEINDGESDDFEDSFDEDSENEGKKSKKNKEEENNLLKKKALGKNRSNLFNSIIEREKRKSFFSDL